MKGLRKINMLVMLFLLLAPLFAKGEDVAVIVSRNVGPYQTALQGFESQAKFTYRVFNMDGDSQKGADIVSTLTPDTFKAVVTIGTEATLAAKNLPSSMPLIYSMVLTPLDFQRQNTAGIFIKIDVKDQIQIMKKLFPNKKRIGVIYTLQLNNQDIAQARKIAEKEALTLSPIAVEDREEIPKALAKLTASAIDILWMVTDTTVGHPDSVKQFIIHSQQQNLPLFGFSVTQVKAGALAAFSADYADIGRQTASLTQQSKNGTGRNVLEGPKKIIVYVNPRVKSQLGLSDFSGYADVQYIE